MDIIKERAIKKSYSIAINTTEDLKSINDFIQQEAKEGWHVSNQEMLQGGHHHHPSDMVDYKALLTVEFARPMAYNRCPIHVE